MPQARKIRPESSDSPEAPSSRKSMLQKDTNVIVGSLWMVGITLALFFVPAINGIIGGLVGGYKVGSPRNALIAAILPALVVAAGLVLFFSLLGFPVLGFFTGSAIGTLVAISEVGLLIGALIGGLISANKRWAR